MNDKFKKARDEAALTMVEKLVLEPAFPLLEKNGATEAQAYREGADWAYEWCNKTMSNNSTDIALEQKLAIAVEALEHYQKHQTGMTASGSWADKALKKIKGES